MPASQTTTPGHHKIQVTTLTGFLFFRLGWVPQKPALSLPWSFPQNPQPPCHPKQMQYHFVILERSEGSASAFALAFLSAIPPGEPASAFALALLSVIPPWESAAAFAVALLSVIPPGESAVAFALALLSVIPQGNLLFSAPPQGPKARTIPAWGIAPGASPGTNQGLKARSIANLGPQD